MTPFLFLSGVGVQELISVIIFAAIFVGIFLALRSLFLWYWKVDTMVKNQEIQIKILTEILIATKGSSALSPEEKARLFDHSKK
jgi:hypothetical protein